jgi:hypothetical protein
LLQAFSLALYMFCIFNPKHTNEKSCNTIGKSPNRRNPDHLSGVKKDIQNWKSYLLSSTGGAWAHDEIHDGINITKNTVSVIQNLCKDADIAIIIYSGHGYMDNGKTILNINDYERLALRELRTNAKRQITIVDACRVDYSWSHDAGIYGLGPQFGNTRPDIARVLYDFAISKSDYGHIILYAVSPNQKAVEDSNEGGKYTLALLYEMSHWGNQATDEVLMVGKAFNLTSDYMKGSKVIRKPQVKHTGDTTLRFPFAVSSKAFLKRIQSEIDERKIISQPKREPNWGKILVWGTVAIGVGAILSNLSED